MFRQAYKETADHPGYVPIGQRARELWLELNARTGKDIFYPIGCVTFNHPSMHNDELDVCKLHGLKHELLKKNEWKARWPIFADIPEEWSATYEADGGLINVDLAIQESVEIAKKQGAEIHENVRVVDWKVQGNKVYVHTADKQVFIGD
jgi:sarcosine oxidase